MQILALEFLFEYENGVRVSLHQRLANWTSCAVKTLFMRRITLAEEQVGEDLLVYQAVTEFKIQKKPKHP